jgi:hypothetical protein
VRSHQTIACKTSQRAISNKRKSYLAWIVATERLADTSAALGSNHAPTGERKMKHIDINEVIDAVPIRPVMSRRDKLLRWAELVDRCHQDLVLYHGIEHMRPYDLANIRPYGTSGYPTSAFTIAIMDPTFQAMGLTLASSVTDAMRFFELSQGELHGFSCDCGGYIDNHEQARRIARLA